MQVFVIHHLHHAAVGQRHRAVAVGEVPIEGEQIRMQRDLARGALDLGETVREHRLVEARRKQDHGAQIRRHPHLVGDRENLERLLDERLGVVEFQEVEQPLAAQLVDEFGRDARAGLQTGKRGRNDCGLGRIALLVHAPTLSPGATLLSPRTAG